MSVGDDAARRAELKGYLGALASDLRQWTEWARDTGSIELPADTAREMSREPSSRHPPAKPAGPEGRRDHQRRRDETAAARAPRPPTEASARPLNRPRPFASPRPAGREALVDIRSDLGACTRCELAQSRKNIVFGVGNPSAPLVVVGEAPGRNEDLTGEPFVGRAGALLNRMLEAIGLSRDAVYICNVLKCRPPNNRDPHPGEVSTCGPFLHRQLQSIAPRVILTVGRFASVNIIGRDASMGELRRSTALVGGVPVVATYHPAYLLRTPLAKRKSWEDLLRVRELLNAPAAS